MPAYFNEDNTIEQMVVKTLSDNGWKYIPAEELPRLYSDVMVEPMVKAALIRLNPVIAEDPTRADEVIYKLRTVILSVQPHNLVTQNEVFKKLIFEENSYPFGKDGRMVPIRFFGTMKKDDLALNEYVVTNQWVYPQAEGGKRLDRVINLRRHKKTLYLIGGTMGVEKTAVCCEAPVVSSAKYGQNSNDIQEY